MQTKICDITSEDLRPSVKVIREAFSTVAADMGLTESNCPTHPSFVSIKQLEELRARGLRFLGLFLDGEQVGFVALERADHGVYYIEKLAIIPQSRHKGLGRYLLESAINMIRQIGGQKVLLAIINEHAVLKNWYDDLGFSETGTKRFEHLPFTVCYMEKSLK